MPRARILRGPGPGSPTIQCSLDTMVSSPNPEDGPRDAATPQKLQPCGEVLDVLRDEHSARPHSREQDEDVGHVVSRGQESVPTAMLIQKLPRQDPLVVFWCQQNKCGTVMILCVSPALRSRHSPTWGDSDLRQRQRDGHRGDRDRRQGQRDGDWATGRADSDSRGGAQSSESIGIPGTPYGTRRGDSDLREQQRKFRGYRTERDGATARADSGGAA